MNRYLAFFGDNFYPHGGMEDFLSDHDTPTKAMIAVVNKLQERGVKSSWGHVYDIVNKKIVYKN